MRLFYTALFVLISFSAFSQVKCERRSVNNGGGRIFISVVDSLSGSPLPGATIMVVSGKDTSRHVLQNVEQISINNDFKSDSLELLSSLFGKNTKDALSMVLADEVKSVKVYNAEPEKEDNVNIITLLE